MFIVRSEMKNVGLSHESARRVDCFPFIMRGGCECILRRKVFMYSLISALHTWLFLGFSLAIIFIREYYLNRPSSMFYLLTRTRVDIGTV